MTISTGSGQGSGIYGSRDDESIRCFVSDQFFVLTDPNLEDKLKHTVNKLKLSLSREGVVSALGRGKSTC